MATRQLLRFLLPTAMISLLAGCGGGGTFNVQNPPPPPVKTVTIAFQPAPVGSLQINQPTDLAAVVSNDPNKTGVDWTVTCQNPGNCGSLSALHTSSGQATTYTPPAMLSGNRQMVSIVAFATADHSQNVVAPIAVTAFGSVLAGTYVLQAQGVDSSLGPYQFAGVAVLDGNGGITSGEQTVNLLDQTVGLLLTKSDPITGGSYFLGADGRGTITLNTNDQAVGVSGTEEFSLVFLSSAQALIAQVDGSASGSGSMDLQGAITPPTGGYAFVASGLDLGTASPTAFGGIFNINSPNTISGKGSISDQNLAGTVTQNQTLSGTVSDPDPFGAVTIDLTLGFAGGAPVEFIGYMVDALHMKLIESDNVSGGGFASTGGLAIGQGPAAGTFKGAAAFSGNYVFGVLGSDVSVGVPSTFTAAGVFNADGAGHLANGTADLLLQGNCIQASCAQNGIPGAQISGAFTGTYVVPLNGIGRARVVFNKFSPAPKPNFQPAFAFYLTGNGNPPLVLDISANANYPTVGAGIAYPQSATPTFGGKYGFSLTQQNGGESDSTAQMTADTTTNTLAGFMDTSSGSFGNPITGSFAVPGPNGAFTGGLGGQAFEFISPLTGSFAANFYAIDSGHGFFTETDLTDPNNPSGVVSLGYYAVRSPTCAGCP